MKETMSHLMRSKEHHSPIIMGCPNNTDSTRRCDSRVLCYGEYKNHS